MALSLALEPSSAPMPITVDSAAPHEEPAPMLIDLVFETVEALPVGSGLAFQYDGAAARQDQSRPHQEPAVLSEGDLAVIGADELRALRDHEVAAGRAVIDVLGDLRRDRAGKVGSHAGNECSRNDRAGLHRFSR
jgi:hypothetical protein